MNFKDIESWSDNQRLVVGIPLMAVLLVVFLVWYVHQSSQILPEPIAPEKEVETTTIAKDRDFREVYLESHINSLLAFHDTNLMDFAVELNKTCPYYEPDGDTYRGCIIDLIKEGENKLSSESAKNLEEDKQYCSDGALELADEGSDGYVDTYNTCLLYKLQKWSNDSAASSPENPEHIEVISDLV